MVRHLRPKYRDAENTKFGSYDTFLCDQTFLTKEGAHRVHVSLEVPLFYTFGSLFCLTCLKVLLKESGKASLRKSALLSSAL